MLHSIGPTTRVLVAIEPVDFRAGIDTLVRQCRAVLREEPFAGTVFVFRNRRRTGIRTLHYDGQGFWLCYKRFSSSRLSYWPTSAEEPTARLRTFELAVLLAGGNPGATLAPEDWRPVIAA